MGNRDSGVLSGDLFKSAGVSNRSLNPIDRGEQHAGTYQESASPTELIEEGAASKNGRGYMRVQGGFISYGRHCLCICLP